MFTREIASINKTTLIWIVHNGERKRERERERERESDSGRELPPSEIHVVKIVNIDPSCKTTSLVHIPAHRFVKKTLSRYLPVASASSQHLEQTGAVPAQSAQHIISLQQIWLFVLTPLARLETGLLLCSRWYWDEDDDIFISILVDHHHHKTWIQWV